MNERRTISPEAEPEEVMLDRALRPQRLDDLIGQPMITKLIEGMPRMQLKYIKDIAGGILVLIAGSIGLVTSKAVILKMLPFDNKSEFQVVLDMPEGTALPVTANLAHRMADKLRATQPEITAIQLYAGTARPFDFNGTVRHYYLRSDPWQGELQI